MQCRDILVASDTPASKKMINAFGLSHKSHPCHYCSVDRDCINLPRGYTLHGSDPVGSQSEILQSIFNCRGINDKQKEIDSVDRFGFRYSEIFRLTGFNTSATSPLDPMHNSFLGLTKAFINLLFEHDLLPGEQAKIFRQTMERAGYPGHLGRIPTRIGKQLRRRPGGTSRGAGDNRKGRGKRRRREDDESSSEDEDGPWEGDDDGRKKKKKTVGNALKADHWKRILQMLPIALFNAWREPGSNNIINVTDEERSYEDWMRERHDRPRQRAGRGVADKHIESEEEDLADPPTVTMDRRKWYNAALGLTASLRILHAHFITYQEACDAVEVLALLSRSLLEMGANLTINWHAAMHYAQ